MPTDMQFLPIAQIFFIMYIDSMKREVYRIENDNGIGPYQYDWVVKQGTISVSSLDLTLNHNDSKHPSAYDDRLMILHNSVFGFISMERLNEWFVDWKLYLHMAHFHIGVYLVDEETIQFGLSRKQIIFKKGEKVKEISLM